MTQIKERKQLTKIILYDGDPVITDTPKDEVDVAINWEAKFISFWERTVNRSNIKEVTIFKVDEVENFILWFDEDKRVVLKNEIERRKKEWQRINITILSNFLESNWLQ